MDWKEVLSRLMWVRVKIEQESWVFILAYGLGREKSEEEIEEFWNELSECVRSFCRNESVVVLFRDLNTRVENDVIEEIVGWHGMPGRNKSGERLLEMCAEQDYSNSCLKKTMYINTRGCEWRMEEW